VLGARLGVLGLGLGVLFGALLAIGLVLRAVFGVLFLVLRVLRRTIGLFLRLCRLGLRVFRLARLARFAFALCAFGAVLAGIGRDQALGLVGGGLNIGRLPAPAASLGAARGGAGPAGDGRSFRSAHSLFECGVELCSEVRHRFFWGNKKSARRSNLDRLALISGQRRVSLSPSQVVCGSGVLVLWPGRPAHRPALH
jgi:hypothetical protein